MKLFDVYQLYDIAIVSGSGCKIYDEQGNEYLDLYGGHAVISIGHANPTYAKRISEQVSRLGFYSNSVHNRLQEQLAERLGKASGYDDYSLFLINSGAEANENALKLASFHTGRSRILALSHAFHGRTSLAVEATDNPKIQAPINTNGHVSFLPADDLAAWERELGRGDVAAVILECIQGVGGVQVLEAETAQQIERLCKATGTVLICDEIQCGYGRSGRFFAHQHLGIRPHLITMAKGIANGFPMGAVLIAPCFEAVHGRLGTTFGGSPLACAAALATLGVFERNNLQQNAREVGDYLLANLRALQAEQSAIREVRGRGLMIGIELSVPQKPIRDRLIYEEHCFTGASGQNTLRLLPPLCLSKAEANQFIDKFRRVLQS